MEGHIRLCNVLNQVLTCRSERQVDMKIKAIEDEQFKTDHSVDVFQTSFIGFLLILPNNVIVAHKGVQVIALSCVK